MFLIVATVGAYAPLRYVLFAMKSAVPTLSMRDIYGAAWPFVLDHRLRHVPFLALSAAHHLLPSLAGPK